MRTLRILAVAAVLGLSACSPALATDPDQSADRLTLAPGEPCPVTPAIEDFWGAAGPFAGEHPVWITTLGRQPWDDLQLPNVLPPDDRFMTFDHGFTTKALVAVSEEVEGDLTITGYQLDGDRRIYFPQEDDLTRVSDSQLQLVAPPPAQSVIEDAHVQTRSPNPPGMVHHGWGFLVIGPGCYAFDLRIGDDTTTVVMEFYE